MPVAWVGTTVKGGLWSSCPPYRLLRGLWNGLVLYCLRPLVGLEQKCLRWVATSLLCFHWGLPQSLLENGWDSGTWAFLHVQSICAIPLSCDFPSHSMRWNGQPLWDVQCQSWWTVGLIKQSSLYVCCIILVQGKNLLLLSGHTSCALSGIRPLAHLAQYCLALSCCSFVWPQTEGVQNLLPDLVRRDTGNPL